MEKCIIFLNEMVQLVPNEPHC